MQTLKEAFEKETITAQLSAIN